MLWFCLNQCVLSEMKDSIKLTVSVQSCSVFVSHPILLAETSVKCYFFLNLCSILFSAIHIQGSGQSVLYFVLAFASPVQKGAAANLWDI